MQFKKKRNVDKITIVVSSYGQGWKLSVYSGMLILSLSLVLEQKLYIGLQANKRATNNTFIVGGKNGKSVYPSVRAECPEMIDDRTLYRSQPYQRSGHIISAYDWYPFITQIKRVKSQYW